MTLTRIAIRTPLWLIACLGLALVGCASSRPPQPVRVKAFFDAAADLNPDTTGRASPLVVRVFQLRSDAEFSTADFFAIYEHEKETLGSSLVSREEYVLQPGEHRELWLPMSRDATFVGAIGAFRDIRGARWRTLSTAPRKSAADMFSRDTVTVAATHGGLTLAVKN